MKTRIIYKEHDGNNGLYEELYEDVAPSLNLDDQMLDIIDKEGNVVGGDVPFALIEKVIFEL